nr:YegP family protein [Phascolarctobacterium succinatutens]
MRFRFEATNGQIIATGGGFKAMAGSKRGIESIKKNVVDAKIIVEAPKEAKAE